MKSAAAVMCLILLLGCSPAKQHDGGPVRTDIAIGGEVLIFSIGDSAERIGQHIASIPSFGGTRGSWAYDPRGTNGILMIKARAQQFQKGHPEEMVFLVESNRLFQADFLYREEDSDKRASLFGQLVTNLSVRYPSLRTVDHPDFRRLAMLHSAERVLVITDGRSDYEPIEVSLRSGIPTLRANHTSDAIVATPVRIVISKFGRPSEEKMEVTDTNAISRIVALFPGYEKQDEDALLSGSWATEYIVDLYWASGRKRCILVVGDEWTAGQEGDGIPLTTNWASVLREMTNSWLK